MNHRTRSHGLLKSMMFSQFLALGCVGPVISLYLQDYLHFDPLSTGLILSASMIAAFTTPLVATFIVDRLVSPRILLLICNLLAGLANSALVFSRDPASFLAAFLLLSVAQGPVVGLMNTLAFHHLDDGVRQYGPVRLWGSLGWVVAGWLLSLAWTVLPLLVPGTRSTEWQPLIFIFALAGSVLTCLLSLWLPGRSKALKDTEPNPGAVKASTGQAGSGENPVTGSGGHPGLIGRLIPVEALRTLATPLMAISGVLYFGAGLMDRLFYFAAAPSLPQAGFPPGSVMAILTLGQIVEIVFLVFLGGVLARTGFRKGFLLGLLAQILRPLLLAIPGPFAALAGIALHGIIVGFLHMGIVMQVNKHCDHKSRSGVNQVFVFLFAGLASALGNLGGGGVLGILKSGLSAENPGLVWPAYWGINALCGVLLLLIFLVWYPREAKKAV